MKRTALAAAGITLFLGVLVVVIGQGTVTGMIFAEPDAVIHTGTRTPLAISSDTGARLPVTVENRMNRAETFYVTVTPTDPAFNLSVRDFSTREPISSVHLGSAEPDGQTRQESAYITTGHPESTSFTTTLKLALYRVGQNPAEAPLQTKEIKVSVNR